jgi:type II secretory pathway pseudopilin PulG
VNRHLEAGFTLVDTLVTVTIFAILMAAAIPGMRDMTSSMRLGQGAREVERELQTARLKAVTSNRPIRVRFNCPVAGQYRMVELIGSSASAPDANDSATNRCQDTVYPYPATDLNPLTRPNHDGPVRRLHPSLTFGAANDLEFWPDGSAHQRSGTTNPWPQVASTGTAVTLTQGANVKSITVNGLGKIQLQ